MQRLVSKVTLVLSFLIFLFLLFFSFTSTAVIDYDMKEYSYFIRDSLVLNLILLVLFLWALNKISTYLCKYEIKHLYFFFMFLIFIFLIYILKEANPSPTWDSARVIKAANDLIHHDYSMFTYGNYISEYPFQIPLVLYYALLILLFKENYIIFEFINIVYLFLIYYYLVKISACISHHKKTRICTLLLLITFLPLQMYVLFLYSNLPSLCFMVLGIYQFLKHYESNSKKPILLSFLFLLLATLLKGTAYILVIAVSILYIIEIIQKFDFKKLILLFASLMVLVITPAFLNKQVSALDSSIFLQETPYKEVALVMGTSYGPRGAGWHNGWYEPYLYQTYGTNVEEMEKDGIYRTVDNLKTLCINHKLFSFYHDKICSMYINPDYQGFWTLVANKTETFSKGDPEKQSFLFIQYNPKKDSYSHLASSILTGKINKGILFYENILMNGIHFGCLLFLIQNRKNFTKEKLLIPLIFTGCFLFFLLWEAKGQYGILFYVLLFPIASEGICSLFHKYK